jgi:L-cysteine S-thiosulfotransferase
MNRIRLALVAAGATLVAAGCATMGMTEAQMSKRTLEVMRASFKEKGQAKLDRLDQDEAQRLCTQYSGKELPNYVAQSIELRQLETIKYPAKLMGEWKDGEKIAQSGRGKQYSDDPKAESGGNCYACHQLSPLEISYGTIGPSLYHFGKLRGYGPDIQKYAYGKIYNAQAFSACSNMPRFGHNAILTEEQIRDLVALLVDPNSPVNK